MRTLDEKKASEEEKKESHMIRQSRRYDILWGVRAEHAPLCGNKQEQMSVR
jgi:hypothetical protein